MEQQSGPIVIATETFPFWDSYRSGVTSFSLYTAQFLTAERILKTSQKCVYQH